MMSVMLNIRGIVKIVTNQINDATIKVCLHSLPQKCVEIVYRLSLIDWLKFLVLRT